MGERRAAGALRQTEKGINTHTGKGQQTSFLFEVDIKHFLSPHETETHLRGQTSVEITWE